MNEEKSTMHPETAETTKDEKTVLDQDMKKDLASAEEKASQVRESVKTDFRQAVDQAHAKMAEAGAYAETAKEEAQKAEEQVKADFSQAAKEAEADFNQASKEAGSQLEDYAHQFGEEVDRRADAFDDRFNELSQDAREKFGEFREKAVDHVGDFAQEMQDDPKAALIEAGKVFLMVAGGIALLRALFGKK